MLLCAFEKMWRSGVHSHRFKLAFVRSEILTQKEVEIEPVTIFE